MSTRTVRGLTDDRRLTISLSSRESTHRYSAAAMQTRYLILAALITAFVILVAAVVWFVRVAS